MSKSKEHLRHSDSSLSGLPLDELKAYANKLGVAFQKEAQKGELLRLIRARQEILLELQKDAMLDICIWARMPVRKSASKEELAAEIATVSKMRFSGLSQRGLHALCKLRGVPIRAGDDARATIKALKKAETWKDYIKRKRRRWIGSVITNLMSSSGDSETKQGDYQFLPENAVSLKDRIEEDGVVGGITRKIKGVADNYVHQKLDEIEARIDHKLDEIDGRMSEWRDREIQNRLRIVKITIIATIIVALISLGYDYMRRTSSEAEPAEQVSSPLQPGADQ